MKTNRIIGIALACLMGVSAFAQAPQSIECIYRWSQNFKQSETPVTEVGYIMLDIKSDKAFVQDYSAYRVDSVLAITDVSQDVVDKYRQEASRVISYFEPKIVQDFAIQRYSIVEAVIPEQYRYEEPFVQGWEMGDDTLTIAGHPCASAMITYAGRTWKVWYTEDIPVPAGPWKLAGLPGLILRAEDSEGEITFDIAEIRNGQGVPSVLPEDKAIVKGTRKEIVEMRNRVMPNPIKNIPAEAISLVVVQKNPDGSREFSINGVVLRQPRNGYIAIEKE